MDISDLVNDVFRYSDEILDILYKNKITDDDVYKIFQNINKELNGCSCSSSDKGKLYLLIKTLFDNNYLIGYNHLTALMYPNDGPYYNYYAFNDDLMESLKIFMDHGIYPTEDCITSHTDPSIIKLLYENNIDLVERYISLLLKARKKRFVTNIIEYLKNKNDFNNRENLIRLFDSKISYQHLLNLFNKKI